MDEGDDLPMNIVGQTGPMDESFMENEEMDEGDDLPMNIVGQTGPMDESFMGNEKTDEDNMSSLKIVAVMTLPTGEEEFTGNEGRFHFFPQETDEDTSTPDVVVKTEPMDAEPMDETFNGYELHVKEEDISDYCCDEIGIIEDFDVFETMIAEGTLKYNLDVEPSPEELSEDEIIRFEESEEESEIDSDNARAIIPYIDFFGDFSSYCEKIEEPTPRRRKRPVCAKRRARKRTNSIEESEKKIPKRLTSIKKRENKKMTIRVISPILETIQEKRKNQKMTSRMTSPVPTRIITPVPETSQEKRKNQKMTSRMTSPVPTRIISPAPETSQEKCDNKKTMRAISPYSETIQEEASTIIDMGYDFYFTIAYNQVVRNINVFQIISGANMSLEELSEYGITRNRLDYFKKFKQQFLSRIIEPLDEHLFEVELFQSSNNQNISKKPKTKFKNYRGMKYLLLDFYSQIRGNNDSCVTFTNTITTVTPYEKKVEFSIKSSELNDRYDFFMSNLNYDHILKCEQVHIWKKEKYMDKSSVEMFRERRPFLGFIDLKAFIMSKVVEPQKDTVPLPIPCKVWTCQVCCYETTVYGHFVAHFSMKTTVYTYLCRRCGFVKFTNICSLLYHILTDSEEETWVEMCLACGKQFPSLTCHLTESRSQCVILTCTTCGFTTKNKCILDYHKEAHKNLFSFCGECLDVFCLPHEISLHKPICVEKFSYILRYCPPCKLYFSETSHFQIHIQFEHYSRINYCSFCKIGFRTVDLIKRHVNEVHPNGYHRILNLCTICPQNTFRKERQEDHFSSHAMEERFIKKAYYCMCGFITIEKGKFSLHLYNCTIKKDNRSKKSLFLKMCATCNCLKFYNFSDPFICEKCQNNTVGKRYICTKCDLVIPYDFGIFFNHFLQKHPSQKKPPVNDTSFQIVIINNAESSHCSNTTNVTQKNTELMSFTSLAPLKAKTDRKVKTDFALPTNQKIIRFDLMNNLKK